MDPSEVDYPNLSINGDSVTVTANVTYDWYNPYNGGYWGLAWEWSPSVPDTTTNVSSCSIYETAPDQFSCDVTVYVSGAMQFDVEDSELQPNSGAQWNQATWEGAGEANLGFCGGAGPDARDTIIAQYTDTSSHGQLTVPPCNGDAGFQLMPQSPHFNWSVVQSHSYGDSFDPAFNYAIYRQSIRSALETLTWMHTYP